MKKNRNRLQNILLMILSFLTILNFKDLFFNVSELENELLSHTLLIIDGWAVPVCTFYLFELTKPGCINLKKVLLVLIPFIAFTSAFFIDPSIKLYQYYWIFIIIYGIGTLIALSILEKKYQKHIENNYSYHENIGIAWLNKATLILSFCLIIWVITCVFGKTKLDNVIYYLSSIIFWLYILYHSEKLISIEIPLKLSEEVVSDIKESVDDDKDYHHFSQSFIELLNKSMIDDKLYLNPKLTISDVANFIGTNRTYLSHYINNTLQTNFYDYINNYRIENASKSLLTYVNPILTIEEVAEKSGFNSTSTFRRAFLKNTGMTPLQFRKTIQQ